MDFVPFLKKFYGELSAFLSKELINERHVVKTMKSEDQVDLWRKKSRSNPSSVFMKEEMVNSIDGVISDFGFGFVDKSGNINMKTLLGTFREALIEKNAILNEMLDWDNLNVENGIHYKGWKAKYLIFCQGHEGKDNPYFPDLPFRQTKGEVLIIYSPELRSTNIIHNKINIVPMENDHYWVGATFDWKNNDLTATEGGRKELEEQLKSTLTVPFDVIDHWVGMRPTIVDRRPIIGMSSKKRQVGIFNGMGTRGVMIAPYYSAHFLDHLIEGKSLDKEVDVRRFSATM